MPRIQVATFPRSTFLLSARRPGVLAVGLTALALGGCAGGAGNPLSLAESSKVVETASASQPKSELQKAAEYWGEQFKKSPSDAQAAINYARNLKALGAKQQAMTVLQAAHTSNPMHKTVNSELGRLALELDQVAVAQKLLEQADDPVNTDWKTISARGTVLAKQGKYREAIHFFDRARHLAPEQSSVLNNLALAHAMDGRADKAETMLRDALQKTPDDGRIAQNLSLVLSLQGKHEESKSVLAQVVSPEKAAEDAQFLKQMVRAEPVAASAPQFATTVSTPTPTRTSAVTGKAPISTASVRPAPGKSMAVPTTDAASQVQKLADMYSATPSNQPVDLAPKR